MNDTSKWRREKGAELIEFAFVLPLLLLISLGSIEFGRAYYTYHILTKALRDGARYAAESRINSDGTWVGTDNPSVVTRTKNLVVYGNPSGSGSKILPDLQTSQVSVAAQRISDTEMYVNLSVSYPYSPLFSLIIPTSLTLRPSVKMQFIGQVIFPS